MKPGGLRTVVAGLLVLALTGVASMNQSHLVGYFEALRPVGSAFASQAPAAGSVEEALRAVVQRANEAQQRAFDEHDPGAMRDTATDEHYQRLLQINRDLAAFGVAAIELVGLEWGPVSVDGTTARLTTVETWRTTLADGTTVQSRELNDYTLVEQGGAWRIDANGHPDPNGAATAPGAGAAGPGLAAGRLAGDGLGPIAQLGWLRRQRRHVHGRLRRLDRSADARDRLVRQQRRLGRDRRAGPPRPDTGRHQRDGHGRRAGHLPGLGRDAPRGGAHGPAGGQARRQRDGVDRRAGAERVADHDHEPDDRPQL